MLIARYTPDQKRWYADASNPEQRGFLERELMALTPGGSEFAGSPLACLDHIKGAIESQDKTMRTQQKRLNRLAQAIDRTIFDVRNSIAPEVGRYHSLRPVQKQLEYLANRLAEAMQPAEEEVRS